MDEDYLEMLAGEEIIGAEEIIGYDEVIGARGGRRMGIARARQIDPNAVVVRQKKGESRRRKILASPSVSVGANATETITYETEELFRPERYVVESTNAASFTISDISVGTRSQFASAGDVPAEIFRPDAVGVGVHFETANVGNKIKVTVTNTTAGALDFRACFVGTSIA